MTKPGATPEAVAARGKVRIGTWMVIAGSLGAILALLTYIDVWDVSDTKPLGWALAAAASAVLAIAGFVVLWGGMTAGARAMHGAAPNDAPTTDL